MALTPVKPSSPNINSVLQANPGDKVSSGKGEIAPVVAVLSRQLPLPQAQQLAGQTAMVRVVKSGPGNEAELEFNGQNLQVKLPQGRTLTAGEMVTVAFALTDKADALTAGNAQGGKRVQDTRNNLITTLPQANDEEVQESPSFVDKLSTPARLIGFLEKLGQGKPTTLPTPMAATFKQLAAQVQVQNQLTMLGTNAQTEILNAATPGLDAPEQADPGNKPLTQTALAQALGKPQTLSTALAQQVSAAVEKSGLFYESHLQQWVSGQRSTEQLAQEPQARFGAEQVIGDKGLDPAALNQSAKLVTAQLATLDSSKIALSLQGLMGQPIDIEIEPDHQQDEPDTPEAQTEAARPWVARLKLDMPYLGELQVRVRMVGSHCDVQIEASPHGKQALDPHWQSFQQAMKQQGLDLVHGQVRLKEAEPGGRST
ncbi:flagellar hook-length control protein FliK [Limnobacter sp.]|uniref:flagellar hook-length control protein FliK n=1 Tax=Limnobacter sp. TaxID=2003368 RepID=UPI0035196DBD